MGRYPLVVFFYKTSKKEPLWARIAFKVLAPRMTHTHAGISVGPCHYWFGVNKKYPYLTTNKAVHKIKKFDLFMYLGDVESSLEKVEQDLPRYDGNYSFFVLAKWGVVKHFKWLNYLGVKRPKTCADLVCDVLNKNGIPIPSYGGDSLNKIRRWLYENNFVLWEGRYRKDNDSKGTDASSV
tara:strand:- start:40426 stop:40968 length:543 start_codon:yes stop_codon:yes gene_type:complete